MQAATHQAMSFSTPRTAVNSDGTISYDTGAGFTGNLTRTQVSQFVDYLIHASKYHFVQNGNK
jgi:hypothetical protein